MSFEDPSIHNVRTITAEGRLVVPSDSKYCKSPFSTMHLFFTDTDGTKSKAAVYFADNVPHEYVAAMADAINGVSVPDALANAAE